MAEAKAPAQKKSGLRKLKPSEIIFNEGDYSDSLYIIQKGAVRLFRPKGKGFIEIAVLRAGEVLGEMAFFDEDGSGRKRSCSAESMGSSEVIEISFAAFGKTINSLNPWFKTIFNTMATRIRKANAKVKALESNSVSSYGVNQKNEYKFFQGHDIVRILAMLFLTIKTHGENKEGGLALHFNTIFFYAVEIYGIQEVKVLEFMNLLCSGNIGMIANDEHDNPKIFVAKNLEHLRQLMVFFNKQRISADDKKMVVSPRCEIFLSKMLDQANAKGLSGEMIQVDVTEILKEFEQQHIAVSVDDLADAKKQGFVGDVMIGEGGHMMCPVMYDYLASNIVSVRMLNLVNKFNASKTGTTQY